MKYRSLQLRKNDEPIFLASTGGHLEQLFRWAQKWGVADRGHWITFENDQSRSLLRGLSVTFVDYVAPRDLPGVLRTRHAVVKAARQHDSTVIVSTGAAIAVSGALACLATGCDFLYIESLARVDRLSMTGRILKRWPGISRFTQSERLVSDNYRFDGSILDEFTTAPRQPADTNKQLRVLVTLGTIRPFGFNRVLQALDAELENDDVTWQVGESDYVPSHGRVVRSLARDELIALTEASDVVVSHAGVGSILASLSSGKVPVVVARQKAFNEHIDDHQFDIADLLDEKGLVHHVTTDQLTRKTLLAATGMASVSTGTRELD